MFDLGLPEFAVGVLGLAEVVGFVWGLRLQLCSRRVWRAGRILRDCCLRVRVWLVGAGEIYLHWMAGHLLQNVLDLIS